jgi:hypothetical protein
MEIFSNPKVGCRTEKRVWEIVELSCRCDRILEAPELDLKALAVLVADYEAGNMPSEAEDLRIRQ